MSASRSVERMAKGIVRLQQILASQNTAVAEMEGDLQRQRQELAAILAPGDISPGEKIGVWVRIDDHDERLAMVTCVHDKVKQRQAAYTDV